MAWTYGKDPENSQLDEVRFLTGDTNINRQLLCDEEINYTIAIYTSSLMAAANAAEAIEAKFASKVNVRVGDISKSFSDAAKAFRELAKRLRRQAIKLAVPRAPALSRSQKQTASLDTDAVQPQNFVTQGDSPFAIQLNRILVSERTFRGF